MPKAMSHLRRATPESPRGPQLARPRPMEADVREELADAAREPADPAGLFTALLDQFGTLGEPS